MWNINNKIQTIISKLIELCFSSSKLERSRRILQSLFKNSRLSLNGLFEIQLDGSSTQANLLAFLSDLQVANKKLGEASPNVLRILKISTKHVISIVKAKQVVSSVAQSDSTSSSVFQLRPCGSNASDGGQLAAELINQLLIRAGIELNPRYLKSKCCKKLLGKSTKKAPTVWCHVTFADGYTSSAVVKHPIGL